MFEAREHEQPLALDLPVEPPLRPPAAHTQQALVALVDFELLARVQAPRHALPEDHPLDLALHVLLEAEPLVVDLPRARHAPLVEQRAEAGAEAEAEQVQPARLVVAPLAAPAGEVGQNVAELADGFGRPGVLAVAEGGFEPPGQG